MLESVVSTLKKSAKSDSFCTKIAIPHKGLSLEVDLVGLVQFPISARTAKALIVEADLAKFGRRDKTVLDRQVRDVWEIPANRIKLSNEWGNKLESVLLQIQKNLELSEDGNLTAELHNLLIYMPGQFFKGHQDSEKIDGMLATLVVLLPSEFSGGELIIDQHGDKQTFRAPHDTQENLTAIAFYSDCHHEVKKVTSGYRVALTYNLTFKPSSKGLALLTNPKLEKELEAYFSDPEIEERSYRQSYPRWFVYLLDHEYSQKSLGWQWLRSADRKRVAELLSCADHLNLQAHLALADIHETWSTEEEDWDYGSYRKRRYYSRDEDGDEDESNKPSDEHSLVELINDEIELRHWIDRSGHQLERKGSFVPREMVCWTKAIDEFRPFQSDYEGYMGNYGNTLDRWYHRGAIVLWQKESEFANLFVSDKDEALKKISGILKKNLEQGRAALKQIMPLWPESGSNILDASCVFELATLVQDAEIAAELTASLGLWALSEKNMPKMLELIKSYGEDWYLGQIQSWAEKNRWDDLDSLTNDLVPLVRELSQNYRKISLWILEYVFSDLIKDDVSEEKSSSLKFIRETLKDRINLIDSLFKATQVAGEPKVSQKLVKHVLDHPRLYPAVAFEWIRSILENAQTDSSDVWGYRGLLTQLVGRLEKESSYTRRKDDWSIHIKPPHSCSDCKYLVEFLSSDIEQKLIWPLAKERRSHIHDMIDGMDISVTHETQHTGSPHKLVLTKTAALFKNEEAHMKKVSLCLMKFRKALNT